MSHADQFLKKELIHLILEEYSLPTYGTHGISHWARVLEIGLRLAKDTGANTQIVSLFAIFHDSKRQNEKRDIGHGKRGADYAATLRGTYVDLSDTEFDLLYRACELHTDGLTEDDITVQTCWDSDRLDLCRVSIEPKPECLCTMVAKDEKMISWASNRAKDRFVPEIIRSHWNIN